MMYTTKQISEELSVDRKFVLILRKKFAKYLRAGLDKKNRYLFSEEDLEKLREINSLMSQGFCDNDIEGCLAMWDIKLITPKETVKESSVEVEDPFPPIPKPHVREFFYVSMAVLISVSFILRDPLCNLTEVWRTDKACIIIMDDECEEFSEAYYTFKEWKKTKKD